MEPSVALFHKLAAWNERRIVLRSRKQMSRAQFAEALHEAIDGLDDDDVIAELGDLLGTTELAGLGSRIAAALRGMLERPVFT